MFEVPIMEYKNLSDSVISFYRNQAGDVGTFAYQILNKFL